MDRYSKDEASVFVALTHEERMSRARSGTELAVLIGDALYGLRIGSVTVSPIARVEYQRALRTVRWFEYLESRVSDEKVLAGLREIRGVR